MKNRNISSRIKDQKFTDYAALNNQKRQEVDDSYLDHLLASNFESGSKDI